MKKTLLVIGMVLIGCLMTGCNGSQEIENDEVIGRLYIGNELKKEVKLSDIEEEIIEELVIEQEIIEQEVLKQEVSSEYLEELGYNSQENDFGN